LFCPEYRPTRRSTCPLTFSSPFHYYYFQHLSQIVGAILRSAAPDYNPLSFFFKLIGHYRPCQISPASSRNVGPMLDTFPVIAPSSSLARSSVIVLMRARGRNSVGLGASLEDFPGTAHKPFSFCVFFFFPVSLVSTRRHVGRHLYRSLVLLHLFLSRPTFLFLCRSIMTAYLGLMPSTSPVSMRPISRAGTFFLGPLTILLLRLIYLRLAPYLSHFPTLIVFPCILMTEVRSPSLCFFSSVVLSTSL